MNSKERCLGLSGLFSGLRAGVVGDDDEKKDVVRKEQRERRYMDVQAVVDWVHKE